MADMTPEGREDFITRVARASTCGVTPSATDIDQVKRWAFVFREELGITEYKP